MVTGICSIVTHCSPPMEWMGLVWLLVALLAGIWTWHIWVHFLQPHMSKQPPMVSGWLPFVGCAIQFGKGPPIHFIKQCQKKYGDTFTLHLAGRHLTFLLQKEDVDVFFSRDEAVVDFQYATQPFLSRCFGVPKDAYFQSHEKLLHIVRSNLLATKMDQYVPRLGAGFENYIRREWRTRESTSLWGAVQELNFLVTLNALLGDTLGDAKIDLQSVFHRFDSWFEIASSDIPHLFLWRFTSAKSALLHELRKVVAKLPANPSQEFPTTAEAMRKELGSEGLEHWLLAIMWAGEANAIPTLFWTLYYLLKHPEYCTQVQEQMDEVLKGRPLVQVSYKELLSLTLLKNALDESIRLHAPPMIVRGARQPVKVKDYVVPQGDFLCLSPFWTQRDESMYAEPSQWKPQRWEDPQLRSSALFLAFGRGKYRCPGQSFAYCGMILALGQVLRLCDISLVDSGDAVIDPNNLVGLNKPLRDLQIRIQLRE